ncbi:aminomethyl transferase family protein [Pseudooceanicola sp. 216_PA32_1]|uniref:Aminomethyl transferase family protein n=1 Tax=Pseudooceanicola pacificus TaxID=2676438 RepID=A0A844W5C5_9RHOB|nr:aminomethyl transferase family protein [Pseudooceanicola pacificus]MWB78275.1 aminomethyl transferase family protein [Pseudooceanicola pacificus]
MTDRQSFQDLLDGKPDLVDYFYNDAKPWHASAAPGGPVPPAYSNWRDEQLATAETAALLHQTYILPALYLKGPDALKLLSRIAVNGFANYGFDRGKQFVAVSPNGYLIGDCILYRHGEESFELVSGAPVLNWVIYHAETGGYDVETVLDESLNNNPTGRRRRYRFEICGPNAKEIFASCIEGEMPDIGFFRFARVRIAGKDVMVLRHGMTGSYAVELSGPYDDQDAVRDHILKVGEGPGLKPMGMTAYYGGSHGGWIPYPVPGILTDPAAADYRRYLPAHTFEAGYQLGGSFVGSDISDYYATPYDFGYEKIIKFDHDFFGREALEKIPDDAKRKKVSLVWNHDDIMKVLGSQFGKRSRYKAINFPSLSYAWKQCDEVRNGRGDLVGLSLNVSYVCTYGEVVSIALLEQGPHTAIGTEVLITWGEPNGGSRKPQVERHEQTTIRATVAEVPFQHDIQRNVTAR